MQLDSMQVLDAEAHAILDKEGVSIEDIDAWTRVLVAENSADSVSRYAKTVDRARRLEQHPVSHIVPLQILRAVYIPPQSFRLLLAAIRKSSQYHDEFSQSSRPGIRDVTNSYALENSTQTESAEPKDQTIFAAQSWDKPSGMILAVRLLRHARRVAPDTFPTIVDIACSILLWRRTTYLGPLADYCNKLLKLIALPTTWHPVRNASIQQVAQLKLVRSMTEHRPELPINREGYRALISVQLAHRKTPPEDAWARVKSLSWPPWREDRLGMDASLEYPGRESRAAKLLRRMNEAGYAHGVWEVAAKIMAGWDTDASPTIQTRRMPLPSLVSIRLEDTPDSFDHPSIWAARIVATRTVREAWAAFLSYRKKTVASMQPLDGRPFEAMFEKLFASPQDQHSNSDAVPGDGKETWSDPSSPLDVIYVDKAPPSVEGLYTQMRKDGVEPGGRLLSALLRNSLDLDQTIKYIKDARLSDDRKDVLLNAHNHPAEMIRVVFETTPPHVLGGFIGHLFAIPGEASTKLRVRADASNAASARAATPIEYAMSLLSLGKVTERVVYSEALKGLSLHASQHMGSGDYVARRAYTRKLSAHLKALLGVMRHARVDHDFTTFRYVNNVYQTLLKWGPWPRWRAISEPATTIKDIFADCTQCGRDPGRWLSSRNARLPHEAVPDPHDLRLLVETLGIFQDIPALIELIAWMSKYSQDLSRIHSDLRSGLEEMRNVMIVARIFIEGRLQGAAKVGSFAAAEAKIAGRLYVPTDVDCAEFLQQRDSWVRRHNRYIRARLLTIGPDQLFESN
ncbi:uncharacterized protein HMPREF1541_02277 [Cyphellophora europaea CBS 101466]|uniref:Uncharacterized protein n=1 Tax=Cyphellophora europaea (strain CBS 101466) TaxID=1220924 RepID=W2S591_CYPE1|nr:uncharacterized protein HMPREF1541_02277 [Cyphellophora europaea CBS 101466]ETN43119.1 hypothetical protein HMPREF1541_02277 [Cyphellophora europaea CBS 101466]